LAITIDEDNQRAVLTHEALAFDTMSETLLLDIDANPLKSIEPTNKPITLAPLSINKIVISND
jgi:hypothetical protein